MEQKLIEIIQFNNNKLFIILKQDKKFIKRIQ